MGSSIESRFTHSNDQRLFDQKVLDVVVTPNNSKVLLVHMVTSCFFVFGNRWCGIDVPLSFGHRLFWSSWWPMLLSGCGFEMMDEEEVLAVVAVVVPSL
jgi:hypothetical protein